MRHHPVEPRDGSELIVFDEEIDFVAGVLAGVLRRQKYSCIFVRIAPTQIFVTQKRFELIVERSKFGASHFARDGNGNMPALNSRRKMPVRRGDAHVPRPKPVGTPRSERQSRESQHCEQAWREEFCCRRTVETTGEIFGWHGCSPRCVRWCHILERQKCMPAAVKSAFGRGCKSQKQSYFVASAQAGSAWVWLPNVSARPEIHRRWFVFARLLPQSLELRTLGHGRYSKRRATNGSMRVEGSAPIPRGRMRHRVILNAPSFLAPGNFDEDHYRQNSVERVGFEQSSGVPACDYAGFR